MKKGHPLCLKLVLVALLNTLTATSFAGAMQEGESTPQWHYTIAPYGWLASLSADLTVKNTTAHVFVPFSKALKDLDFSGEIHLEAHHGPWTFMIDPTYTKLSPSQTVSSLYIQSLDLTTGPTDFNLDSRTLLIDGGVFYQAYQNEANPKGTLAIEALAGARYYGLKNQLSVDVNGYGSVSISSSINAIAPIVGIRIKQNYSKTQFWLRADVGGFGVDNVKSTWSTVAGVAYRVKPQLDLGLAYRVLKINVSQLPNFQYNALMYGPELGVAFQY